MSEHAGGGLGVFGVGSGGRVAGCEVGDEAAREVRVCLRRYRCGEEGSGAEEVDIACDVDVVGFADGGGPAQRGGG